MHTVDGMQSTELSTLIIRFPCWSLPQCWPAMDQPTRSRIDQFVRCARTELYGMNPCVLQPAQCQRSSGADSGPWP